MTKITAGLNVQYDEVKDINVISNFSRLQTELRSLAFWLKGDIEFKGQIVTTWDNGRLRCSKIAKDEDRQRIENALLRFIHIGVDGKGKLELTITTNKGILERVAVRKLS
jgi:hypothetical protein